MTDRHGGWAGEPLVSFTDVEVRYGSFTALAGIDLAIESGDRVGLVGGSGSGKSTLLAAIAGSVRPSVGSIQRRPDLRLGLLLQDPAASLNPRWSVTRLVEEPLRDTRPPPSTAERNQRVHAALDAVRLGALDRSRRPAELSGGQCQRVALARALVARPHLVLADEPTSALDVSIAAGVLRTLLEAVTAGGAALVIVSHDLLSIAPLVNRILVLEQGRIVEEGSTEQIMVGATHPVTRRLVDTARLLALPLAESEP
jgi:peptide/nickel transport system ATP-binding protein